MYYQNTIENHMISTSIFKRSALQVILKNSVTSHIEISDVITSSRRNPIAFVVYQALQRYILETVWYLVARVVHSSMNSLQIPCCQSQ